MAAARAGCCDVPRMSSRITSAGAIRRDCGRLEFSFPAFTKSNEVCGSRGCRDEPFALSGVDQAEIAQLTAGGGPTRAELDRDRHCRQSSVMVHHRPPQSGDGRARQQNVDREGVDQPLHVLAPGYSDLGCVGITEEVMAEFVGEVETAAARVYVPVDQGHAHISDLYVCRVTACLAELKRERKQPNTLAGALQVIQRTVSSAHEMSRLSG